MLDATSAIDPSEWFGRMQRAYLACPEESVLDELADIGRLLAVTGTPVESVLETHGAVLAERLATPDGRAGATIIEDATVCLSEVLVAWRVAAESMAEQVEGGAAAASEPAVFLRFDRQGALCVSMSRHGAAPADWAAATLEQALAALGVAHRLDEVRDGIAQRRLTVFEVHPPGADERMMRAVICPFRDGSAILGVHDVSARHAAAEAAFQRRKLESLGQLAGGIAHEINNLLQPILTAAQFVAEDHPDLPELQADIRIVLDSARAAADVVNDVLAFARRGPTRLAPLRLAEVVRRELAALRATLPASTALVAAVAPDDEAATVEANACELGLVLRNLANNAFDAMEGVGTVTVSVGQLRVDAAQARLLLVPPGDYVRLSVADTGPGIDPATARRIFDPFFTTKAIGKGTGLGLAIVRGIVQSWGGVIVLRVGIERGTVFDILLPATASAAPAERVAATRAPAHGGGAVVMVIDDDAAVADAIARTLRRAGFVARVFPSAGRALAAFDEVEPRLVISDVVMDGIDGLALAAELQRRDAKLPVLLMTGGAQDGAGEDVCLRARQAGAAALLFKPVSSTDLLAAVQRSLKEPPVWQAESEK